MTVNNLHYFKFSNLFKKFTKCTKDIQYNIVVSLNFMNVIWKDWLIKYSSKMLLHVTLGKWGFLLRNLKRLVHFYVDLIFSTCVIYINKYLQEECLVQYLNNKWNQYEEGLKLLKNQTGFCFVSRLLTRYKLAFLQVLSILLQHL